MSGGTKTEIYQPTPAPQPSTADAINAWVQAMPQVYQTQMQYAPLEAQQQVELAQQYAQPLGQAYLDAQKAMYPEEYALKDQLSTQAKEGMQSGVPDWMQQQYLDNMRGMLGENALSGAGADYMSRGLLQQQQDWQNYYQNMALSLSGSQPIYNAASPQYSNYMSNYTPQSAMNYTSQNYGTFSAANRPMTLQNSSPDWFAQGGQMLGGMGGLLMGIGAL